MRRSDLALEAGISEPTLQRAISELRREGWIGYEFSGRDTAGRRGGPLRLTRRAGLVVGVDVGRRHLRAAVADVHGNLLTQPIEPDEPIDVEDSGSALLHLVAKIVVRAVSSTAGEEAPYRLAEVRAIGVGVPSPVDARGVAVGMFLPQWSGLPLPEVLTELLAREAAERDEGLFPGLSIKVAKDADLGVLKAWQEHVEQQIEGDAELDRDRERGKHAGQNPSRARADDSLVFVKASTGVDAGLVCQGHLVTGSHGLAGQLGHMSVPHAPHDLSNSIGIRVREDRPTRRCRRCTRPLCLENLASGGAVLDQLERLRGDGDSPGSMEELVTQVRDQTAMTPLSHEAVVAAGTRVGLVLAEAVRVADPTRIVVGGLFALAGEVFMTPLRVAFSDAATGGLSAKIVSVPDAQVKRIELEGAIVLARKHLHFAGTPKPVAPA
jgi:predicted NBD/HSP70 family sugar kinase